MADVWSPSTDRLLLPGGRALSRPGNPADCSPITVPLLRMSLSEEVAGEEAIIKLVRLALSNEVSKRPLRREDIINALFGTRGLPSGLPFKELIARTNECLLEDFDMELVPLSTSSRQFDTNTVAGRKAASAAAQVRSSRNPTQSNTHSVPSVSSSSAFILLRRKTGMIAYRDCPKMALLAVILCLISLSENQQMDEDVLKDKLALFGIEWNARREAVLGCNLEEWISDLKRQRYLVTGKRSDEANITIYSIGPRAVSEFPPEALAGFVTELGNFVQQTQNLQERLKASFNY